jgi:hypothetical protein
MDLLWWSEAMLRFRDSQVLRGIGAKALRQHSDASGGGWGCTTEEYGTGVVDYIYGLFTPELPAHTSNYRELLTVYAGLRRSRELHSGGEHLNAVAYTDNSVSATCVNSGTSRSAELLPLVKEMGLYMVEHGITCKCVWIPTHSTGCRPSFEGSFPLRALSAREERGLRSPPRHRATGGQRPAAASRSSGDTAVFATLLRRPPASF